VHTTTTKEENEGEGVGKRIIKLAVSVFVYLGDRIWHLLQRMVGKEVPGTCVVLYYHSIPLQHREQFCRQMDVLIRNSAPVRADTEEPLRTGAHHAAIVFHDAFVSVYENALPELARRGIPSTLFVPSGYLGQRAGWIKDSEHPDYGEVVVDLKRLKSLDAELVCVGSHGVTHSDLSTLAEEVVSTELERSKLELETIVKKPVTLFAFPYGGYRDDLTKCAKEVGYRRIFTILPKLAFSTPDEYTTGSCRASPADWNLEFKMKLLGAYRWLPLIYDYRDRMGKLTRNFGLRKKLRREEHSSIENR
jgi:peptidoglycan/xylan/chitin deacetylase (PgdA/CDA1 family)